MQRWWIGGVAVAGVALAVLLIGTPDTGGEVTERPIDVPQLPDSPAEPNDGIIRGGMSKRDAAERSPSAVPLDENGMPLPIGDIRAMKPGAREVSLRQQLPEGQWASRTMAPWTQIRRELAKQDQQHPAIAEVNALLGEMRELRRDPATREIQAILEQQDAVEASVRASGLVNDEVERMLELLGQRKEAYERGDYSKEALEAAEDGALP